MPRLSALRNETLRDLADQFRFASRKNALRALSVLDTLSERIEDDGAYSARWLVHELTGYTPDEAQGEAIFPGDALRGELSALSERICAAAALEAEEVKGARTVEDLAERWGVTRRTIERYRRDGLVARRVGEGRSARLLFTTEAVACFERVRAGGARSAAWTDEEERARIAARAQRYRDRMGWGLAQTAERLAVRTGRSPSTVRRIIAAHDRAAREPIFPGRASLDEREREAIMRAVRRGVPMAALAEAKGRSRESIARIAGERVLARLRGFDLRGPVSATFERADAGEVLLAPALVREGLLPGALLDAGAFFEGARSLRAPDAREEATLAAALAFLRFRAARTLADLPAHGPSAGGLDRVETDLRWASRLVVKLARTQRRIALAAIEERVGDPLALRDEHVRALHLAAMRALCDAALRFDPFGSGRLAARSSVGLTRALSGAIAALGLRREEEGRAKAKRRRDRAVWLTDWTAEATAWSRFVEPDARVRAGVDGLDGEDGRLLTVRFGLDGSPPRTREEAAEMLGLGVSALGSRERCAVRAAVGLAPTPTLRRRYPAGR